MVGSPQTEQQGHRASASRAPVPQGEGDAPDHFREAGNVTADRGRDKIRLRCNAHFTCKW